MNLKVYKKEDNQHNNGSENQTKPVFYKSPKLIRRNGIYYIGFETDEIRIEEWEAVAVYEHPELVYDLIVSYRRKYYFNTAEDSLLTIQHFG